MPNAFTRFFGLGAYETVDLFESNKAVELQDAYGQIEALRTDNERATAALNESVRELSLWFEDVGWERLDGWTDEAQGFSLKTIKEQADRCRSLLTVNPIIKKASNARIGFVWGRGVSFDKVPARIIKDEQNKARFFSDAAHDLLERTLQTDGNVFALRSKNGQKIVYVPLEQITGWTVDENDPSRVEYWLREYDVRVTDYATGAETDKHFKAWYPAAGQGGTVRKIADTPVDRSYEMVHTAVNRQAGWILGIPDIVAGMFWARAHKELFEAGTTVVKARGRYASKVVANTKAGAQKAAAAVAATPRRDETTGEILEYGGTAVMSSGLDMQLMGRMSDGVDFTAFKPVLAMVAAGLEVPVSVLSAESQSDEESLEQSIVDAAVRRQNVWSEFFDALFGRPTNFTAHWPQIKTDTTYRQIQSIEIANRTNLLSQEELRELSLDAFGVEGDPTKLPPLEDNPNYTVPAALAKLKAKLEADAAEKAAEVAKEQAEQAADNAANDGSANTPDQGVDANVGKLSNGSDAHDARDKGETK